MRKYILLFLGLWIVANLPSCKSVKSSAEAVVMKDTVVIEDGKKMIIKLSKGESYNHPTFVIWVENLEGDYDRTLYITKSYATGVFGYEMKGDTMWVPSPGVSLQPAALPYWTHKKGPINDKNLVPTPDNPFVDAVTGPTPKGDFSFETGYPQSKRSRILLEVNQTWDWDSYWTNNKYQDSEAYKHSAQPSVIYAVTIEESKGEYFLNPIGYGDPKGETGRMFTDIQNLSTAKNIFNSVKIEFID